MTKSRLATWRYRWFWRLMALGLAFGIASQFWPNEGWGKFTLLVCAAAFFIMAKDE